MWATWSFRSFRRGLSATLETIHVEAKKIKAAGFTPLASWGQVARRGFIRAIALSKGAQFYSSAFTVVLIKHYAEKVLDVLYFQQCDEFRLIQVSLDVIGTSQRQWLSMVSSNCKSWVNWRKVNFTGAGKKPVLITFVTCSRHKRFFTSHDSLGCLSGGKVKTKQSGKTWLVWFLT